MACGRDGSQSQVTPGRDVHGKWDGHALLSHRGAYIHQLVSTCENVCLPVCVCVCACSCMHLIFSTCVVVGLCTCLHISGHLHRYVIIQEQSHLTCVTHPLTASASFLCASLLLSTALLASSRSCASVRRSWAMLTRSWSRPCGRWEEGLCVCVCVCAEGDRGYHGVSCMASVMEGLACDYVYLARQACFIESRVIMRC
jgi:hypothetical protein